MGKAPHPPATGDLGAKPPSTKPNHTINENVSKAAPPKAQLLEQHLHTKINANPDLKDSTEKAA